MTRVLLHSGLRWIFCVASKNVQAQEGQTWQAVVRRATALLQDDLDDSGGDGARIARRRVQALLNRIPEEARHDASHMRKLRRRLNAFNLQSLRAKGMEKLNMLVGEAAGLIASWRERAQGVPSALARRLLSHAPATIVPTPCRNRESSLTLQDLTEPYVRIGNHKDNLCYSPEEAVTTVENIKIRTEPP